MIICPTCDRSVQENARVCRGCYTILPEQDAGVLKKQIRPGTHGLKTVAFIAIMAAAGWLATPDPEGSSNEVASSLPGSIFSAFQSSSQDGADDDELDLGWLGGTSFSREGSRCIISQRIQNLGDNFLTRVAVVVGFLDTEGKPLGSGTERPASVNLGPGAVGHLSMSLPCPERAIAAKVTLPPPDKASGEQIVKLLSPGETAAPVDAPVTEGSSGDFFMAVKAPDRRICPGPTPCKLKVSLEGGGSADFRFQRHAQTPEFLTSTDSILIAHLLAQHDASIREAVGPEDFSIQISHIHVQKRETHGLLARVLSFVS